MPRRARLKVVGLPLHLIQRGNNRGACFYAEEDYSLYLHHLGELARKFRCAVHAYVLMTNHVHLLLTPARLDGPSLLMKHLGQRYVQYVNRVYRRSGTLWEGRFRSSIVQQRDYLLRCYRYIELNPVRAGMVSDLASYVWSSYAVNSGARPDPFVAQHPEFSALAVEGGKRHRAYRGLFEEQIDEPLLRAIRDATNTGYPLASDTFKSRVLAPLGWKTAPAKRGPRSSSGPDPELGRRVVALTPN